ncbi:TniQ family protein [Rubellimicrobium roseum]|uniref:TniQ domain-containing protein n=1 Tax=Rubellimicrobium roseum TaxID=687525 RepID=A0A5C4NFJ8_9RHOB|nr:TniQ family protein [Rubellimicrobium roseum]TNC72730.1 hypothetical protein FHG71_07430 [Rubellimicrobium roseum]
MRQEVEDDLEIAIVAALRLTVPLGSTEPLWSFASRLGRLNGRRLTSFLGDFKVLQAQVRTGHDAAVAKLADLGGADAEALRRFTPEQRRPGHITLAGESLPTGMCVRSEVRVCPACLRDDVRSSDLKASLAVHGRAPWLLSYLRTCPVHDLPLVRLPVDRGHEALDFSNVVAPQPDRLHPSLDADNDPPPRSASDLDRFVVRRLTHGKGAGATWPDTLSLHAAARFSEVLGVTLIRGRMGALETLSEAELATAGARGFEIIAQGPDALSETLEELRTSRGTPQDGPQARYAPLHTWATSQAGKSPEFEPLRAILRQHILDRWPLRPGTRVLGHKVTEWQRHSIRTASIEWGIHARTLRRILAAGGLVAESADERGDAAEIFSVEDALPLVAAHVGGLTFEKARARLDMSRSQMDALIQAGLLVPTRASAGMRPRFKEAEIARFEAAIEARLVPYGERQAGVSIPLAVKMAKASAAAALSAILDGKLPVSRRPGATGYLNLVVNAERLRQIVHGPPPTHYYSYSEACTYLGLPAKALKRLIDLRLLRSQAGQVPNTSLAMTQIDRASVEAFHKAYVSLARLARELGQSKSELAAALTTHRIWPVSILSLRATPIYRRADLQRLLEI